MPSAPPFALARALPAKRRGRPVLLALAVLLIAGAWLPGLGGRTAVAQASAEASLLHEEATLQLPGPAGAVSINADESILAAAVPDTDGRWRVLLFDRPSHNRLGYIETDAGGRLRLRFSPVSDLLLIAGDKALELWEVPIGPLKPNKPLGVQHRRWAVTLAQPPGQARFGKPPDYVYWSQGAALYRRSVDTGLAYDGKPFWQPANGGAPIADFAFDPSTARMALVYRDSKQIGLLDLNQGVLQRQLQGHRFPVLAAHFMAQRPLLSLDAGNELMQWQHDSQPVRTTFLDRIPQGFHSATFMALGDHNLLLVAQDGRALAIAQRNAAPVAKLRADNPGLVAVSPTGRYVLAARDQRLILYGFAQPTSPLAYVRHLRDLKAYAMARSYVRLMDDQGLSPDLLDDLREAASREPPGQALQIALQRLKSAMQGGDADRIRYWAQQALALRSGQPDAVAALRTLRNRQDAHTLDQARQAFDEGQFGLARSLLRNNEIGQNSPSYVDAQALERMVDARIEMASTLDQARERLAMGDFAAAQALVQEVLSQEPDNRVAHALQDEIAERSGANQRQMLAAGIGLALACLLMGFVAFRFRRRLAPVFRKLRLDTEADASAPLGRGPVRRAAAARSAAAPRRPEPERSAPRPQAASTTRRRVIASLIEDTETRLERLRQADVFGRLTARLMELEAELSAIQRRMADPMAELGPLHNRLKAIARQVLGLRVPSQGPEPATAGPDGAGGAPVLTHYEVLQLAQDATAEQIRVAYHKLIKQYHPDLHNASQFDWVRAESERMSRRIAEAYHVLGDADARARYDRQLRSRRGPLP